MDDGNGNAMDEIESNVSKYPVDFEALIKDSWIEQAELETAFGMTPEDKEWTLRVLGLNEMIRERVGILARKEGNRIRLMSDSEASDYNFNVTFKSGLRKFRRSTENVACHIDPLALTASEQLLHESRTRIITMTTQATLREENKAKKHEKLLLVAMNKT